MTSVVDDYSVSGTPWAVGWRLDAARPVELPRNRSRGWMMRRALVAADILGLTIAFTAAETLTRSAGVSSSTEVAFFVLTLPLWVVMSKLYGLYDHDEERTDHSTADEIVGVFHLATTATWFFYLIGSASGVVHPRLEKITILWLFAIATITCGRAVARALCRRHVCYLQNALIVGAGDVGQMLARKYLQHPEYGVNVVGLVDEQPKERRDDLAHLTIVGGLEDVPELIGAHDVERVIIAFSNDTAESALALVRAARDMDVQVDIVPRLFDALGTNLDVHLVEGVPLLGLPPTRLSRSSRVVKRAFDITFSALGLAVLAIPFGIVAALIKLDSSGPVFFRQVRMGSNGAFHIFKFRTMCVDAEERKASLAHLNQHLSSDPRMFKIPDDPRVTRIGKVLRRFSLDELPQLINVLIGEMSIVGPRPLILAEDGHIIESWARRRLDLKPGITGLWQVAGRSDIPFSEMIKLDYAYVTGWSLLNDLRLVFRTLPVLLRPSV